MNILNSLNVPNAGLMFIGLEDWEERKAPELHASALAAKWNRQFAQIAGARVFAFGPPPLPGYGNVAGFTIATLRPDGWPQATTVGYVNEGLTLWFLCGLESQKATNLAHDSRVSITIDHDTPDIMSIKGLSMAARAHRVRDRAEAEKVIRMLPLKYPDAPPVTAQMKMPTPDEVAIFRVVPEIVSVLDYTKGFGHTDLVRC
jgi:hypothetical protein